MNEENVTKTNSCAHLNVTGESDQYPCILVSLKGRKKGWLIMYFNTFATHSDVVYGVTDIQDCFS